MNSVLAQSKALASILATEGAQAPRVGQQVAACATELIQHGEFAQAADLCRVALGRLGSVLTSEERLRVGIARVWALLKLDQVPDAEDELRQLREVFGTEAPTESVEWGLLRCFEGSCLWRRNETTHAIRQLEALRSELILRPDSRASCLCSLELMTAYNLAGNRQAAREMALEAWVSARRIGHHHWQALSAAYLARFERQECHWHVAMASLEVALEKFRAENNDFHARYCRRLQGIIEWKRGVLRASLESADEVVRETDRLKLHAEKWEACMLRSLALTHMGRFSEARVALSDEPDWQFPSKFSRRSLLTAEYLGDIELEQGNAKAALARYAPALTQALALVPRGDVVAELRRRIAECHLLLGEPKVALGEALEALAHCREIHERYDEAATHRIIAMAHVALGNHAEAKKAFDAGFAEYDEIETPYEWGKLWLAYGDWLAADASASYRNLSAAREAYIAAIDHFERMGAEFRLGQARERLAALDETMRLEGEAYAPTHGKVRPARRPRHSAELLRRSQWALDTFGLVTRSGPLLDMLHEIASVAASDLPVLVLGESGTGKELIAHGVHMLSGRTGEFLAINCSAVPEAMLEGEFFGYMKGSFTNAVADKPGLFEVAHDGTVFLDEIGEMSPDLQAKLLRFLETGALRRVGATRDQKVDTRIIAATNRERGALQSGNSFRSDLYYRLAHAVYELPPLRARGDDIDLLVDHFLGVFNRANDKRTRFSAAARAKLLQHAWPGNVRELQAAIHKLVVAAAPDATFTPRDLPALDDGDSGADFIGETNANEKKRIIAALEQAHFVKTEAAHILRISRTTLLSKMKRLGVEG